MIREDWVEVELGHVCEKVAKVKRKEMPLEQPLIYIDIGGIDNALNKIVNHKEYTWSDAPSRAQQVVRVGDVLFSTVRTYLKNVAQVTNPKYNNEICSSGFTVIRGREGILHPRYVFYLTLFEGFLQPLNELQTGTSYPAVRDRDVFAQRIRLAPYAEQRAIVAKIEQLFSELDNGIANLKAAKDKLKLYREAVLKKAFEGELTKIWRDQLGGSNKSDDEHDDNSQVEGLPIGWMWTKLGQVTEVNPSLQDRSDIDPDLEVQFIPMKLVDEVINNIHLDETRLFKDVQKRSYTYFAEGDVLFAKVTPCMENGKIAVARNLKNGIGYGSSEFHVFRCSSQISNQFLFYFLVQQCFRQDAMHAMTGAVGLRRVPKKYLEDYKIALPPILEQMQIIEEIENRLSVCDNIIVNIEKELEKSEALRQSILKKAFEGKLLTQEELDVCRREPDWEPAEKLLERIKKQRNEQV